jgi:hypothetical protein
VISAILPDLLRFCQVFYYTFGGVKSLKDISVSRHERVVQTKKPSPKNQSQNRKKTKNISLAIGSFQFQYFEECALSVESVEYLIV